MFDFGYETCSLIKSMKFRFQTLMTSSHLAKRKIRSRSFAITELVRAKLPLFTAAVALLALSACGQISSTDPNSDYIRQIEKSTADKEAELVRYAAAHSACRSDADCQTAEVGLRACGGPRYHVALSNAADSSRVRQLQDELERLEYALLVATNAVSTCEYRMPPQVLCVPQSSGGGLCQAQN